VANLSKRTTEGTFSPVPAVAAMAAVSGPLRGTDVMKHTTRSGRRSLPRETTSRAALVAREIGERKSREDDAAEREHSKGRLDQIGVRVERRLFGQPIETLSSLCDRGRREFSARSHLDQHVHPGMRGNAAASEFGRDLASFVLRSRPPAPGGSALGWDRPA
jgi:hypothetical protein